MSLPAPFGSLNRKGRASGPFDDDAAGAPGILRWAGLDSNQGPRDYESPALTG